MSTLHKKIEIEGLLLITNEALPPSYILHATIDPELRYLRGHFPNRPVVPGFIQIGWVVQALRIGAKKEKNLVQLQHAKFTTRLSGDERIVIEITEKTLVTFAFKILNGIQTVSSGLLECCP